MPEEYWTDRDDHLGSLEAIFDAAAERESTHRGYVDFANSSVHVSSDPSRTVIQGLVTEQYRMYRQSQTRDDPLLVDLIPDLPYEPADAPVLATLAHELIHAMINMSTFCGWSASLAAEMYVGSAVALMAEYPSLVGKGLPQQWASSDDSNLAARSNAVCSYEGYLRMLGLRDVAQQRLPLGYSAQSIRHDGDESFLVFESQSGSTIDIPITFRLVSENLATSVESVFYQHLTHGEELEPNSQLPWSLFIHYARPATRAFHALSLYIMEQIADSRVDRGSLTIAVLEVGLLLGADIHRGRIIPRPFGRILEVLISAAAEPHCPSALSMRRDEHVTLVNYFIDALKKENLATYWDADRLFAAMGDEANNLDQIGSETTWGHRRSRYKITAEVRRSGGLLGIRLAFDTRMLTTFMTMFGTSFYSPSTQLVDTNLLSLEYGTANGEFDFQIVDDALLGRRSRCPHNRNGECTGILFGVSCSDTPGSDESNHPCGFFDHRRDYEFLFGQREDRPPEPTDNLKLVHAMKTTESGESTVQLLMLGSEEKEDVNGR